MFCVTMTVFRHILGVATEGAICHDGEIIKMNSIFTVDEDQFRWIPNGSQYELRAGDTMFAKLTRREAEPTWHMAETADGAWALEHEGTYRKQITVYHNMTNEKVGLVTRHRGPVYRLLLLDSMSFTWKPSFERGKDVWKFLDAQNQELFLLSLERNETLTGTVRLLPFARNVKRLPLLLVLGWDQISSGTIPVERS